MGINIDKREDEREVTEGKQKEAREKNKRACVALDGPDTRSRCELGSKKGDSEAMRKYGI